MRHAFLATVVATLCAAVFASAAAAAPVNVGSSSGTSSIDCSNLTDCTVIGQLVNVSGRLLEVRVGHGEPAFGATPQLTLKLFRRNGSNFDFVRNIGTPKAVAQGSTSTSWTGLNLSVTEGQFLGYFVDNEGDQLPIATTGGSGITMYKDDVNTSTNDPAHTWPPPIVQNSFSPRIAAVVHRPPIARIDQGPPRLGQDTSASFAFSADEEVTWECELNGSARACSNGAHSVSGLSDGDHVFRVRGTNTLGQTGAWAQHPFRVDRTAPDTTLTDGPNGVVTSDPQPTFRFTANELATFECRLDGSPWHGCESPSKPGSPLADGQHTLEIRATDEAGNVESSPATAVFTVRRATSGGETPPAPTPSSDQWGIPFGGTTWDFTDPVDGRSGPGSDIASVRIVYDAAGRFGVLLRFHGTGSRRVWVDLHRSADCTDRSEELWISTQGTDADIWATASMVRSTFTNGRTSADGREILVVLDDPRTAGLAFRCLHLRSMAGDDVVDQLRADLTAGGTKAPVEANQVIRIETILVQLNLTVQMVRVTLNRSLDPIARSLRRRTPRQLAARATHVQTMPAPGPGSVGIEWSVSASVARKHGLKVRRGTKKVTLAVGAKKVGKKTAKVKVPVKVSAAGKKILRRAKKVKVQVRSGYLPQGGDELLAATRQVQVGGGRR